ncbi:MAG: chemotaxis protein CheA, partial [Chloroflexi bacterium]|nr:chemotaxis protein CheA [Chloroflexota bacterium]
MHDKKRQELYELFQAEATEHLERMNEILLQLEAGSSAPEEETLRELFRVAHSLKGAARTVNRTAIERVAHALESVFEAVRSGKLGLDPDIADVLYDGLDSIQVLLSGQTEQLDLDGVLANLAGLITDEDVSPPGPSIPDQPSPHAGPPQEPPGLVAPLAVTQEIPAIDHQATDETIRVPVGKLDHLMAEVSNLLVAHMNIEHRVASLRELRAMHRRWQKQWRRVNTTYIRLVRAVTQNPAEMSQWKPVLDFLQETQRYMRITGKQFTAVERALNEDSLALGFAADALQSGVRDLRLLPFETIVGVLQRTVRDVARELNKEVLFRTVGTRIELDKHVLELLKDPLIHILRNALDHGIEPPDTRERLGKPRQGLILLSLMQRSSKVHVIITDDGYGIDPERVMRRAAQIDLVSSDEAQHMNETEIYELLMQPGMSTRETVSTISGRGVGLDVVRDHLEALQGQIQIRSRIGEGTSFELVLPVSLSTIHCMLVRTGNELYAIPTTAVLRVIEYHADAVFQVKGKPMLRLDNSPVPVAFLADTLERGHQLDEIGAEALAIVLSSADRQYAFVVDDIVAEQEVVVRNLNSEMARVRNVSGATLLANG